MSKKMDVTIDVIIHATEDLDKFLVAIEKFFGIDSKKISKQHLTGHFDNPIILLSSKISKKDAENFLEKFIQKITQVDLENIRENINQLISSSGIHLRLDKQEFINGNFVLKENNVIKLKIYVPVYNKKEAEKTYLELFERSN